MVKRKTTSTSSASSKRGKKSASMVSISLPKQSQYPKAVYFGTEIYKLVFKKGFDCYGETDWEKKTITIKAGLSPRQILSTFIHELLHVIEGEQPLKIKHSDVYSLERAILEILLDNFL